MSAENNSLQSSSENIDPTLSMTVIPKIEVVDIPSNYSDTEEISNNSSSLESLHTYSRKPKLEKIKQDMLEKTTTDEDKQHNPNIICDTSSTFEQASCLKADPDPENSNNKLIKNNNSEAIHCDICDKVFQNSLAFGLHSIKHNSDKKYWCHMCKYKTITKGKFSLHIKVHEGKAGFKCEICDKYFPSNMQANEHKNFHTGEKPFQCDLCGKSFMFSKFLSSHRRNQHFEELTGMPAATYVCVPCDKQYTCISGLKRHQQRYHTEAFDQSRLCDICGKRLASEDKLKFHRRIHTGYKPFSCAICAKSFTRKDWLKEHERIHTGERPFTCNYCGKGFTQRSPLKIHMRSHTGEKPYICRICERGFTSKGSMDVHMRKCE